MTGLYRLTGTCYFYSGFLPSVFLCVKTGLTVYLHYWLKHYQENKRLTVIIDHLRDSVTNEKRKSSDTEKENSVLNMEISKVHERLQEAENVIFKFTMQLQS